MKKNISWILAFATAASFLTGCSGKTEEAAPIPKQQETVSLSASPVMEEAAECLEEVRRIADSVAEATADEKNYSLMDCAIYCNDQLENLDICREQLDRLARQLETEEYSDDADSQAAAEDLTEFFSSAYACIDEVYSITEFISISNTLTEEFAEGASNDEEDLGAFCDTAYNAWVDVSEKYSQVQAPKAIGDIWLHFQDSLKYYYEALSAAVKAIPEDTLEDALSLYSAYSLIDRNSTIFVNYQYMMMDQEIYALQHQSHILDGLINGFEAGSEEQINLSYSMTDTIMPNLYPSMDSALNLSVSTDRGNREVLVSAVVEGFTQTYEQKITVTPEETLYMIKPQISTDLMDLDTLKTTQFKFTVTDADTGKIIAQDTQPITVESIYDISFYSDEFGTTESNNILAWVTAESDGILQLRRTAIEILGELFGSGNDILPGYQSGWGLSAGDPNIAAIQIYALQAAISRMGVRYNMGPYSFSETQRVLMPDAVLSSGSGICIETSILMASAVLSTGMHPLIILTPGHAQVAVETWYDSGEYLLVETTMLPFSVESNTVSDLVTLMSAEEWMEYLSSAEENGLVYVLDCALQKDLGIKGLDYYAA